MKFSELRAAIAADPLRAERLRHVTEAVDQSHESYQAQPPHARNHPERRYGYMSTNPHASIGYGYSLGGPDDSWKVTTFDDGEGWREPEPRPTWLNDDATDEDGDTLGFDDQTIRVLYAATPAGQRVAGESDYNQRKAVEACYGVTVKRSGTYEHPGWLLVVADSVQTVEWAEVIDVTGATDVSLGTMLGWMEGLEKAVAALGGPKALAQNGPRWLAWPEYR